MGLTTGAPQIIGKTIVGLIKKVNYIGQGTRPAEQVFLLFSDDTYYEFYSSTGVEGISRIGIGSRDDILKIGTERMRVVLELPESNSTDSSE